jgi:hypothetical protein
MASPLANPQVGTDGSHRLPVSRQIRGRPLAIAAAVVFVVSSAFPAIVGFAHDTTTFPKWWGVADVAVAFVLAVLTIAVVGLARGRVDKSAEEATYRAYRVLIHGIFAMMVAFFLLGDRIVWINCLPGFAWRSWLLAYCLPAWFVVFGRTATFNTSQTTATERQTELPGATVR